MPTMNRRRFIERHELGGVGGDDLRQDTGGRTYLLLAAFIGNQTGQDFPAYVLLVGSQSAPGSPIPDRSQPVFESVSDSAAARSYP